MQPNIILGDCLEVLPELDISQVDLVLADPPYGTTRCAWDSPIPLDPLWKSLSGLRPEVPVVLFAASPFDKVLGASNVTNLRYEWIWEKGNATGFFNAKRQPLKAHENILVFYRKAPKYFPQKTSGHERKATKRPNSAVAHGDCYGSGTGASAYDSTERYPRTVLKFSSDKQRERKLHPTQKPVALLEYLIRTYTEPGDTVLDFCMGSASTGVAAHNTRRGFLGIEKEKEYFDTAHRRLFY